MNLEQARRTKLGMSAGQVEGLKKWGYRTDDIRDLDKSSASDLLDACKREGHRLSGPEYVDFKEREAAQDRSAIEKRGILVPVITDYSLDKLFSDLTPGQKEDEADLRKELKQVNKAVIQSVESLGRVLVGYKRTIPHKKWTPFLEILGVTPRSAQRYMELANIKKELGPTLTKALEAKGVSLTPSGRTEAVDARKIAKTLNELATRKLEEKSNTTPGSHLDDFGPSLTEDEQTDLVQKAIETHRPAKPVEKPVFTDSPEDIERRIRMFEHSLSEDLQGLRFTYKNDDAFRSAVGRIYREVMALQMEVANA